MIDNASIEKLKSTIDIVDVIGNYIELKRAGANYKALCPFHEEKTPSFVVSPTKQIFHCFGCHKGGDAIKFVMEIEHLSYQEAIIKLAKEYNIELQFVKGDGSYSILERALEITLKFYKENLDKNKRAKEYLLKRGINENSIEKFEIGYAPSSNELIYFLKSNHIPLQKALEAGILAKDSQDRYYARLIERVIFPIFSPTNRLIGFGGRTITNHPAKYINSPQTKLFNKSRVLYGYHLAKEHIYRKKEIIVTEGYMDVVMLHQAGIKNSVATLGTALTKDHLPLLRKGEPKITLAYDGDEAGINAAFKAAKMLCAHNFEGKVVLFPNGSDPADLVSQDRLQELFELLREGEDLVSFVLETIIKSFNIKSPHEKERAFREVKSFLNTLSPIIQESFIDKAASLLKVPKKFFLSKKEIRRDDFKEEFKDPAIEALLKTLLLNRSLIDEVLDILSPVMLKEYQATFEAILANNLDDPKVREILIDESIVPLNDKEIEKLLLAILERFYKERLKELIEDKTIPFNKKSFLIRKIKSDIIPRIKKGELVPYESDFTI
ncbi:MAG: DNA primase [Epsilonproteobacteria bacterium]|nr:DNA primase [Campylobacterota bacterium]